MLAILTVSVASVTAVGVAAASVTAASVSAAGVPQLFAWQRAMAGMAAYCSATVISSPMDVLKTRMQLRKADDTSSGMLPLAIAMLRNEGALVFFSGIGPALCMAPAAIVQYTLMDPLRGMMPLIMAAALAGALDITMKCPLDMLKTRLQSTTAKLNPSALLLDIWRTDGVRGLWTGYGATLVRDLPYLIIKWLTYTWAQSLLAAVVVSNPLLSNAKNLLAGALAGAVAATVVTPADVCKTRLQAARMDPAQKHVTTLQIGREVVREGGVPALFSGLGPRLMRIPMYTAVTLATFDLVKDHFAAANLRTMQGALKFEL